MEPPGSCLSFAALVRVGKLLEMVRQKKQGLTVFTSVFPPVGDHLCAPFQPGGAMSYTSVMNLCFRMAGVHATDPRNVHDLQGRAYFPFFVALDTVTTRQPPFPAHYCSWAHGQHLVWNGISKDWNFKGLEYLYLPCLSCRELWVAHFPVVFHPHPCSTCKTSKSHHLSMWEVHKIMYGGGSCPRCGSYVPQVDLRFGNRRGRTMILIGCSA